MEWWVWTIYWLVVSAGSYCIYYSIKSHIKGLREIERVRRMLQDDNFALFLQYINGELVFHVQRKEPHEKVNWLKEGF